LRNEFDVGGRFLLGYGGSESLQSPATLWSDEAKALIVALGVDIARFDTALDRTLYPSLGLARGVFFMREAFGVDKLVTGDPMRMVADDIPPDRMNARPPMTPHRNSPSPNTPTRAPSLPSPDPSMSSPMNSRMCRWKPSRSSPLAALWCVPAPKRLKPRRTA